MIERRKIKRIALVGTGTIGGSFCAHFLAHGYQVTVTELVGWEHSMKNELIIASYKDLPRERPARRLQEVLSTLGLEQMNARFYSQT